MANGWLSEVPALGEGGIGSSDRLSGQRRPAGNPRAAGSSSGGTQVVTRSLPTAAVCHLLPYEGIYRATSSPRRWGLGVAGAEDRLVVDPSPWVKNPFPAVERRRTTLGRRRGELARHRRDCDTEPPIAGVELRPCTNRGRIPPSEAAGPRPYGLERSIQNLPIFVWTSMEESRHDRHPLRDGLRGHRRPARRG